MGRSNLIELLSRYYLRGKFKLASGQESDEYLDVRSALLDTNGLAGLCAALRDHIRRNDMAVSALAAVAVGAVPLAVAAMRDRLISGGAISCVLVVRPTPKEHGLETQIDGLRNLPDVGRHNVLLLEDVFTTGGSVEKAADALVANERIKLVGILAVVDRGQGAIGRLYEKFGVPVSTLATLDEIRAAKGVS